VNEDVIIREAGSGDIAQILEVCSAALGWSDPEWDRQLFLWKHNQNAFGPSLVLVAEDASGILAVRPLMQWRFRCHEGSIRAARAVDTATRPDAQGRGLFRKLTEYGLERLRAQGVSFIFNTPNAKSRPGYLKLGWHEAGRVDFGIRVSSPMALARIARSRVAATKPSVETPDLGMDPETFLGTLPVITERTGRRWRTDHDLQTLLWRYAQGPVTYRALPMSGTAGAIVRVRERGQARELLVAEQIGQVDEETERSVLQSAMRQSDAHHLIGAATTAGTVATNRVGPNLTMREVSVFSPEASDMAWAPGDIELF
jgi:GNAT superfamily N-acetyltransferase